MIGFGIIICVVVMMVLGWGVEIYLIDILYINVVIKMVGLVISVDYFVIVIVICVLVVVLYGFFFFIWIGVVM